MKQGSPWLGRSLWNVLDHAVIRAGDAATTLLLLWALPVEAFSKLALAQALVAPSLLFFVAPETILYREITSWKQEGSDQLARKLGALRKFSWFKGGVAVVLSALLAALATRTSAWMDGFQVLIWAFLFPLPAHLAGTDREFLRLTHHLKTLNSLSLFQKLSLLGLTALVVLAGKNQIEWFLGAALLSALATTCLSLRASSRVLRQMGASSAHVMNTEPMVPVVWGALSRFSFWQHLGGVAQNWGQTMDVFFLGAFRYPDRVVGLYAAALKLANLASALPLALSNAYSIRLASEAGKLGGNQELKELGKLSLRFSLMALGVCGVLYALCPWGLELLYRGRLEPGEKEQLLKWLALILAGTWIMASGFLASAWLSLRTSIRTFVLWVPLPWAALSFLIYAAAAHWGGPTGVAFANIVVGGLFVALVGICLLRHRASSIY